MRRILNRILEPLHQYFSPSAVGEPTAVFLSFSWLPAALICLALSGCSKPAAAPEKSGPEKIAGVTMDAATQARIGLKIEPPVAARWQPEIPAAGNVVDPLGFIAAVAEYETARATGAALAQKTAAAKFAAAWGARLAAQTNLLALAESLQAGEGSLVKLSAPAGSLAGATPDTAELTMFGNGTNPIAAEFSDDLRIDPATQMPGLLYATKLKLPAGLAVTARIKIAGEAADGVTIPAGAVVRHEGAAWVYAQTETNQFSRVEIPLNRPAGDGWFVTETLSTNSRVVVTGAQALLSAEFSTGAAAHEH